MNRAENLLFALYAHRMALLSREQFASICKSLRPGTLDLGLSLAKRHVIDEMQMEALWALVSAQVNALGSPQKAMEALGLDEEVRQVLMSAIKPPAPAAPGKSSEPKEEDPPTIQFEIVDPEI